MVLIAAVKYSDQAAANARTLHATNRAATFVHTCLSAQVSGRAKSRARWTLVRLIAEALCMKCLFGVCLQRYLEMPFVPQIFSELQS